MPSVIRGSDNFDTAGGNAVKAWVNFNGTGTVAIRAQYNVSSITDNGTGDYTVNFTTAMPDANYSIVVSGRQVGVVSCFAVSPTSTTQASLSTFNAAGNSTDFANIQTAIFR